VFFILLTVLIIGVVFGFAFKVLAFTLKAVLISLFACLAVSGLVTVLLTGFLFGIAVL
jgi:hypothetical protein